MSLRKVTLAVITLAATLILSVPADVDAGDGISPDLFKQYVNRIVWIDWHSGGKSYETEGTLKLVYAEQNCISLAIRQKSPDDIVKFEGSRILYINLSSIDAFEVRMPE